MTDKILWQGCSLVTLDDYPYSYGLIDNAAIVTEHQKIVWLGKEQDLPADFATRNLEEHHFNGGIITPGLIDCHTHLVYGGSRVSEFKQRL